ncbi:TIGR03620 family F420-dependent LLM class oxidoreductase [Kitasatospora sp. NPDC057223]|uniref:TIGR03620 family F420-dependent LLM class oxidoreductase n=1 Tax=Kitasatospora sp. NPDC057223 TaxID=3346055 RepID=UPI00363B0AC9
MKQTQKTAPASEATGPQGRTETRHLLSGAGRMNARRTHGLGRIGIWAEDFDHLPAPGIRRAAAMIEDLGYGTLWFPETVGREAMAQAAILLTATRRITVAAGMTDIYARDPVTAAAAQRTLEEAFPGRFLLGLWAGHPSLAEDVRGHRFAPPLATMRAYLDAVDAAPFGPPHTAASPHRVLMALEPAMVALASERARGATVLGMPVEYTRTARAALGDDRLLAVTQLCVLGRNRADTADLARSTAEAALPNRRDLLRELGHETPEALDDRLVDALVAHGPAQDIAQRVHEHLAAGADHVSLHLTTAAPDSPPERQWERLAAHLPV